MTPSSSPADHDQGAGRTRASRMTLRVWEGPSLDSGLYQWRNLESGLSSVPLACSWLWTENWLRVYRDLIPCTILTGEIDGVTQAACLVTRGVGQKSGPVPIRTLHLGTAGEPLGHSVCVEYNGLLVSREYRERWIGLIENWIRQQSGLDEIRVDGWPDQESLSWVIRHEPDATRLRECRYFDLTKPRLEGQEPIELLGRSTRQNLRRILRKYGEIETCWASSLEEADDILHELIQLHQARWQAAGSPGAFASPRFERFQRQLLINGFGEGKVVAFRARHQDETIGCLFLLVDRGRLLDYVSGFADFERKPSPGLITHFLCLTEAARRGYDAYDFLVGDKRHKDNLSTDVQMLAWHSWTRPTLRNGLIGGLKVAKNIVSRLRGQNKQFPVPSPVTVESEQSPVAEKLRPPVTSTGAHQS